MESKQSLFDLCKTDICNFYKLIVEFVNAIGPDTILLVLFIICFFRFFSRIRQFMTRNLKPTALTILLMGMILYAIGFNDEGSEGNAFSLFFRSLLSSLEMFASHSDLIEVEPHCKENHLYMFFFSTTHFSAVFVSAFFIIKLFGYRLYSWFSVKNLLIKWHYYNLLTYITKTPKTSSKNNLFVLWGVNNNSVTLAESIVRKYGKDKALIVLVITPGDTKKKITASRFSFSTFFHLSSDSVSNYIDRIERLDAILMNADSTVNANILEGAKDTREFYNKMSLKALGKIVRHFAMYENEINKCGSDKKDNGVMSFFFLSEDENENIEAVNTFKLLSKKTDSNKYHSVNNFHIYCHARRNYFNMTVLLGEGFQYKVSLIDSSMLAVRQLRKDSSCQPVRFVKVDTSTGTVESAYKCLIIGFGQMGRDALRYLYEFSSFITKEGNESEKHFYIVDENLEQNRSAFLYSAPGLADSDQIEWWDCKSTHERTFWKQLEQIIDDLNCIMICVDGDEEAKLIVGQLYDFVYRYRKDFNNFTINVHVKDSLYEGQIRNFCSSMEEKIIHPFGSTSTIFDYDVITSELLEHEAKRYYFRYKLEEEKMYAKKDDSTEKKTSEIATKYTYDSLWNFRREYLSPSTFTYDDDRRRKRNEDFIEVRYQEEQDISNAWHRETKCLLAGLEKNANEHSNELISRLNTLINITYIDWEEIFANKNNIKDYELIKNLDACEHARWNAKMLIMGFKYAPCPKQDMDSPVAPEVWKRQVKLESMRKRTHHCLIDFKQLRKNPEINSTIKYDQEVVKVSLLIMKERLTRETK